MSLQNPLIANEAMYSKEAKDYFYPQTVAKQVIMEDGNRLDAYLGGMVIPNGMELLWENPDPNVAFPAQTINIPNLNNYEFIIIGVYNHTVAQSFTVLCFVEDKEWSMSVTIPWSGHTGGITVARSVTISATNNTIKFNSGSSQDGGTQTTDEKCAVPYKIYGIKKNTTISSEGTLLNADMLGNVPAEEYVKKSETGMDLLWENASPTSNFAAQTVSLDLSKYKTVKINWRFSTTNAVCSELTEHHVNGVEHRVVFWGGNSRVQRGVTPSVSGVTFTKSGATDVPTTAPADSTNHCIPTHIYGIK